MWAVREAFVAICTTNMPPVVPLLRVWLSPCLGRTESASASDDADGRRSSAASAIKKRSASRASRKSHMQMLHNRTMSDRYFADLEAPPPPKPNKSSSSGSSPLAAAGGRGEDEIKLETYATSRGSNVSQIGRAVDMPPQIGMEKSGLGMGAATEQKRDVDENFVHKTREMV